MINYLRIFFWSLGIAVGIALMAFSIKGLWGLDIGIEVMDSHSLDRRDFGSIFGLLMIGLAVVGWSFFQIQYVFLDMKDSENK
jgi:hypothetical protein